MFSRIADIVTRAPEPVRCPDVLETVELKEGVIVIGHQVR